MNFLWGALLLLLLLVVAVVVVRVRGGVKVREGVRSVVVLGSGGHTAELLEELHRVDLQRYSPRCYVVANTDTGPHGSAAKAHAFEQHHNNQGSFTIRIIPRSREVGQSYVSAVWTTLRALWASLALVWIEKPDLVPKMTQIDSKQYKVLCNGPGTCVPICYAAYLYKLLGINDCKIVFLESIACVDHLSLSGKLLLPIADLFCVQWPSLKVKYRHSIDVGRFSVASEENPEYLQPTKGPVLVTVGSTSFDELVGAVDTVQFVEMLKEMGYTGLKVQYGRGKYQPNLIREENSTPTFQMESFRYKDSLKQDMAQAALIISHAGIDQLY